MATTDPITGATINDQGDAATGGFQIGRVVTELRKFIVGRFGNAAARDQAFTSAGVAPTEGMLVMVGGVLDQRTPDNWGPLRLREFATNAARDAWITVPRPGQRCIVGTVEQVYLNGAWRFSNSVTAILQTSADGAIQFPHLLPGTPSAVFLTQGGAATDAINAIAHPVVTGKDGVNVYVTIYRTDNQQKFTGNIVPLFARMEV